MPCACTDTLSLSLVDVHHPHRVCASTFLILNPMFKTMLSVYYTEYKLYVLKYVKYRKYLTIYFTSDI